MLYASTVILPSTPLAFVVSADVAADAADVIGMVGKRELFSAAQRVTFMDVFNCLSSLRSAIGDESYIANERGECLINAASWDCARMANFLDLVIQGRVGLYPDKRKIESLRILRSTLRNTHEQYNRTKEG